MNKIFLLILTLGALQSQAQITNADSLKQRMYDSVYVKWLTPRGFSGANLTDRLKEIIDFADTKIPDTTVVATQSDLSKKQDKIPEIQPINIPHREQSRSDAMSIVDWMGEYRMAFMMFRGNSSDLGGASIAIASTPDFSEGSVHDTVIVANADWWGGRTVGVPSLMVDPTDSTLRLVFIVNRELVLTDTAKTAWYRMDLPFGADIKTGWGDTVKLAENNRREVAAPDRIFWVDKEIFGVQTGKGVIPFSYNITGTGNSSGTLAYGSCYMTRNFFKTMDTTLLRVINGNIVGKGSVFEPGIVYRIDRGIMYYHRSLDGYQMWESMGFDTTFNNAGPPIALIQSQNAMATVKYYAPFGTTYAAVMRLDGRKSGKARRSIDLAMTKDGATNWAAVQIDHTDSSSNELNEPGLYFAERVRKLIIPYTKTRNGLTLSSMYYEAIPLDLLQLWRPPINYMVDNFTILQRYHVLNEDVPALSILSSVHPDSLGLFFKNMSAQSSADRTTGYYSILFRSMNPSYNGDFMFNNKVGKPGVVSLRTSTRAGKLFQFIAGADEGNTLGTLIAEIGNNYWKVPTAQDTTNTTIPPYGAVRFNYNNNKLETSVAGQWYGSTENYLYKEELTGSSFSSDSTYRDTTLKNKYFTVFHNNVGKYIRRAQLQVKDSGGFKLSFMPQTTDTFQVRIESRYVTGLVPQSYPLDSIGIPSIAVGFRQLNRDYKGYAIRLTSLIDGSSIDVGLLPTGGLDTFTTNLWPSRDSSYISRMYQMGSNTSFAYFQAQSQGARYRQKNGEVYAEFTGTGYLNTNSNTANLLGFLHDGTKSVTISQVFMPTNVTTTSVYGLCGNNAGTSTGRGINVAYDHRLSQSNNNAVSLSVTNAVSGQPPINAKYNNSAAANNTKSVLFVSYNPSLADASARSKIYVNNSSAQQTNTNAFSPTTGTAPTSFSIGSAGSNNVRFTGRMYEFILYDVELTDGQREKLRDNQRTYYNF